jgi:flagellin
MRINYNVSSIIAMNALNNNDNRLSISTQKLSSGYKINSASDDAAGLAIARKMNAQIKSLQRANRNANDGLSVVNTADGAMSEMHSILQRMNELSIQAANGTNADSDREQIQIEIDELIKEVDRIADTTQYNAQNLLDGTFAYKGYTNSENVKVMSYSDGVQKGIYALGELTYYKYGDTTTTYKDGTVETTQDERYMAESADSVKDMLITSASISQYRQAMETKYNAALQGAVTNASVSEYKNIMDNAKAFPSGSTVTLEDENIVIKGDNDFELKITLNDRKQIAGSGVTTASISNMVIVKEYSEIAVEYDGEEYVISDLSKKEETDKDGNVKTTVYSGTEESGTSALNEELADVFAKLMPGYNITIGQVTLNDQSIDIEYTYSNPKDPNDSSSDTLTLNLYQEKDSTGNTTSNYVIDDYLYATSETKKTIYTVGDSTDPDNYLTLDLTGMGAMIVQVGANEGQYLEIEIPALNAVNLGIHKLDVTTEDSATASIDIVGKAINQLSAVRAKIGAYANRIEHTITNLDTTEENMTASYSRIMDVDMAEEMTEYSTVQVLVQAATSVLAQANERPQQVLQLLQ